MHEHDDGTQKPGKRRPDEHSFEVYVERQFIEIRGAISSIKERFNSMGLNIAGIEQDEEVLAQVVPFLIGEVNTLQAEKQAEEAALQTKVSELQTKETEVVNDEAALAQVKSELATAQGELTQVEAVVKKLEPVVAEGEKVLPPAPAPDPTPTATSPTQPVYAFNPNESTPDGRFKASGFQTKPGEGGTAQPLFYFSEDPPNQTLTANGGTVAGYAQFTGEVEAAPAA